MALKTGEGEKREKKIVIRERLGEVETYLRENAS